MTDTPATASPAAGEVRPWIARVYLAVPPALTLLVFLNPFPYLFSVKETLFEPVFTHFCQTLLFTILAMITIAWSLDRRLSVAPPAARHPWRVFDAGGAPAAGTGA